MQLALLRGELAASDVPTLGPQLAEEYPALDCAHESRAGPAADAPG